MPCRLLLVDDHPALTRGLAALLNQEDDLLVTGQFLDGEQLLAYLTSTPALTADVLLLDLHLPPPYDGLSLLPQLRRRWPALRVLIFSSAASALLVSQVAAAGAHGFIDKSAEAGALLAAIRAVYTGQLVFPSRVRGQHPLGGKAAPESTQPLDNQSTSQHVTSQLAADVLLRLHQLSGREREIIGLVRNGLSTRTIATQLALSEFTISTHRRNLMQKLGLHGVADLVRFAHEHGL